MSEVYSLEPPCRGRLVLHTSLGELEIRLWSTQCPRAVRNFVQLCMEGYYNGCIFHRVIPQFMVQTGDPTGTGNGGESIYGEPFENEIVSRLKFRYRGMLGMANTGGKCSNQSQFFITLERADVLNGKYTLFGKVEGHTVYNLVQIGQVETGPDDRPLEPPKIIRAEILSNPFPDIVPRLLPGSAADANDDAAKVPHAQQVAKRKLSLLSFNEDDGEGEELPLKLVGNNKRSAHDLLNDPRLSSQNKAIESDSNKPKEPIAAGKYDKEEEYASEPESDDIHDEEAEETRESDDERKLEIRRLTEQLNKSSKQTKATKKENKRTSVDVMARMAAFQQRLSQLTKDLPNDSDAPPEEQDDDKALANGAWFAGTKLSFTKDSVRAYEFFDASKDTLLVDDPLKGKDNKLKKLAQRRKEQTS